MSGAAAKIFNSTGEKTDSINSLVLQEVLLELRLSH